VNVSDSIGLAHGTLRKNHGIGVMKMSPPTNMSRKSRRDRNSTAASKHLSSFSKVSAKNKLSRTYTPKKLARARLPQLNIPIPRKNRSRRSKSQDSTSGSRRKKHLTPGTPSRLRLNSESPTGKLTAAQRAELRTGVRQSFTTDGPKTPSEKNKETLENKKKWKSTNDLYKSVLDKYETTVVEATSAKKGSTTASDKNSSKLHAKIAHSGKDNNLSVITRFREKEKATTI